ncbi:hypothetical protein OS493_013991 [Desmophyllum pertusum]|uniref:Uncharacterized protein n=1 Tax=Desmophyllum pertusum TaxID=174260 RepID=A0A9W9ZDM9_9CNID|nr:hypothetical protein OS493_013991 [Desmophyllum pertusum]
MTNAKPLMPPVKMSKQWIFLGLALQLAILVLFYRLFFEERTFIVRTAPSEKLPIFPKVAAVPMGSTINRKLDQGTKNLTIAMNWNEIPRKSPPATEEMHDKWIVLTTINSPTADVKKLAGIEGWKVVVVGDTKTPVDWRYCT